MSQPEWEDTDFEGEVDQFFPDWKKVNLKGFQRPAWFFQEVLIPAVSKKYTLTLPILSVFNTLPGIKKLVKRVTPSFYRLYWRFGLHSKIPMLFKNFLRPLFYQLYYDDKEYFNIALKGKPLFFYDYKIILKEVLANGNIFEEFRKFFPWRKDKLTEKDLISYLPSFHWFRSIFQKYDLIHACATDPIYTMLATPQKPYIAFEHGTLRDIPFEKTPQGRLLSLAYRKAKKVIITNPDTIKSAKKLGLENYAFIPHPLDETKYVPQKTSLYKELRDKYKVRYILFWPTRHDWSVKGNDIVIRGFAKYIEKYRKDALLILTLWGNDINKSKVLINDLHITNHVVWVPLLNEVRHIKYINAADIILDQMILPSFGGIAFKGMSCGKPVITSFKYDVNKWCFTEPPPLIASFNESDISYKINELLRDKKKRDKIGKEGREWIVKYHSWEIITDKLIQVYKEALRR